MLIHRAMCINIGPMLITRLCINMGPVALSFLTTARQLGLEHLDSQVLQRAPAAAAAAAARLHRPRAHRYAGCATVAQSAGLLFAQGFFAYRQLAFCPVCNACYLIRSFYYFPNLVALYTNSLCATNTTSVFLILLYEMNVIF